jgi:hypothetical protein
MLFARSARRRQRRCMAQHGCPSCNAPHIDLGLSSGCGRKLKSAQLDSVNISTRPISARRKASAIHQNFSETNFLPSKDA